LASVQRTQVLLEDFRDFLLLYSAGKFYE